MTNARSLLAAGVLFLSAVLATLALCYALLWIFEALGLLWRLAAVDRDAMALAGLICITLAVSGLISRRRK